MSDRRDSAGRVVTGWGKKGELSRGVDDAELARRAKDRTVKWRTPTGSRDRFARNVMALVSTTGDKIKAWIAQDEELARDYYEALKEGVRQRDRTMVRLYSEVMKLVGEERSVVVTVLHQLGVPTMDELERMVQTHKDAEGVTSEQRAAICADYLELYLNTNPQERAAYVRRFGGEVPLRSDSYAVVADHGEQGSGVNGA